MLVYLVVWQAAVADGILDAVIEGIIPKDQVNDLCIVALLWIDPGCIELEKAGTLDKADMYKNNYEAIKIALKRALNDEPSIDELIANRKKIKHCMWGRKLGRDLIPSLLGESIAESQSEIVCCKDQQVFNKICYDETSQCHKQEPDRPPSESFGAYPGMS